VIVLLADEDTISIWGMDASSFFTCRNSLNGDGKFGGRCTWFANFVFRQGSIARLIPSASPPILFGWALGDQAPANTYASDLV